MKIQITSNPNGAIVRNDKFDKIGVTPCSIEADIYQKIYLNCNGEINQIQINEKNTSVFFDFTEKKKNTTEINAYQIEDKKTCLNVITNLLTIKYKQVTIVLLIEIIVVGVVSAFLVHNNKSIDEKLDNTEFLALSDEEKIKHYLKYEDLRDTNYIKSLYDLNNLHYWQLDNISEDLLDVAMAKGDRIMTNRKNEIISITKLNQVYRVDLKFTYTNTSNTEIVQYTQIYIKFNDQGLINYIDNSYK